MFLLCFTHTHSFLYFSYTSIRHKTIYYNILKLEPLLCNNTPPPHRPKLKPHITHERHLIRQVIYVMLVIFYYVMCVQKTSFICFSIQLSIIFLCPTENFVEKQQKTAKEVHFKGRDLLHPVYCSLFKSNIFVMVQCILEYFIPHSFHFITFFLTIYNIILCTTHKLTCTTR